MSSDALAEGLRDLIAEAEDAGLELSEITGQLEAAAEAIREAGRE